MRPQKTEPIPTEVKLYSAAERVTAMRAHLDALAEVERARAVRGNVPAGLTTLALFGPGSEKTRGARLARVKAFLKSGKLPAAWGKPTPAYEGRAGLSDQEAKRVVLPNFPKPSLKLLDGDLGVEGAVGRYLSLVGEREVERAVDGTGERSIMGCWVNGIPASPAKWSCGCLVWKDTRNHYLTMADGTVFDRYEPAQVEPCGRHRGALLGRDEETGEVGS